MQMGAQIQEEILEHVKSDSPEEALANSIRAYLRNLDEMKKGEFRLATCGKKKSEEDCCRLQSQTHFSALMRGQLMGQENSRKEDWLRRCE